MKLHLIYIGGFIALINLLWFAYNTWTKKIPAQNPASWFMWTVIDGLLLGSMLMAGLSPWLPLAYTIGALSVTVAMHFRGKWSIGGKEVLCAICAGITTYFWISRGATAGAMAGVIAMAAAGVPIWIDLFRNPVRSSWPVWAYTMLACFFTLFGSDWSLEQSLLAWSGIVFNGSLTLIVLFKIPPQDRPLRNVLREFTGR